MPNWTYPQAGDLRELVRFSEESGAIWLGEHRMLLFHAASMGILRRDLIQRLGRAEARRILTGMGYEAGLLDAQIARRIRPSEDLVEAFFTGPQLHMLEGSVRVTPVTLDMDLRNGKFSGEFLWHNSWEAEAHVREFGQDTDSVCWMQIGYASGYTTGFVGRPVVFRETECAACGVDHCRIVGKPLEEWTDSTGDGAPAGAHPVMVPAWPVLYPGDGGLRVPDSHAGMPSLVGAAEPFRKAYDLTLRAAGTAVTVLLLGETGVGKERFARALHAMSPRKDGPFVAVNCAAIPHDLIESELFGAEKGAYTGASQSRAGKFERADGGTLFLDEIGEMPLAAQAKVLRAVQEGEVERLGDERTRRVNVRLVAATHVDLAEAVRQGRFRADLYYRLNVYPVRIPPLRERLTDLPMLIEAILGRLNAVHGRDIQGLTDRALFALRRHDWPGNIRELENVLERGVILAAAGGRIEATHLFGPLELAHGDETSVAADGHLVRHGAPEVDARNAGPLSATHPAATGVAALTDQLLDAMRAGRTTLEALEQHLLDAAVTQADGNLAQAARLLGITRAQLSYRLKRNASA